MYKSLLLAASILALPAAVSSPAHADNYPWCAYYSGFDGGNGTNCGFTTREQCMATISGVGGICRENTMYQPYRHAPRHRKAKRRAKRMG